MFWLGPTLVSNDEMINQVFFVIRSASKEVHLKKIIASTFKVIIYQASS